MWIQVYKSFYLPWVAYEWNGKEKMARKISEAVKKIVTRKKHPLPWYGRISLWEKVEKWKKGGIFQRQSK
jgi:hypothetical protein